MDNMFETLMRLPLFQGVGRESISDLIEKYPFHFLKFQDGDTIIAQGDECTHVRFLVSGQVMVTTSSQVLRVSLSQKIVAPNVIGPDYLFGRQTAYPYTVRALGVCGILQVSKSDYVEIVQSNKVYLYNILNYLSRNSQVHTLTLLNQSHGLIAERLAKLVLTLTTAQSEDIVLNFRQKDLCNLLGARRTSLVNALDDLSKLGIIEADLSQVKVLNRRALIQLIKATDQTE